MKQTGPVKTKKLHQLMTDEQLIHCYKTTMNNVWLGHLLVRYTGLLLGVAMKYLKNRAGAEDAVQQVFLKVIGKLPQEEILNFRGWLYILMKNHCLQLLRDRHILTDDSLLDEWQETPTEENEFFQQLLTAGTLHRAINKLHEEQQVAIRLFYLEKKTYEQIMETTGYTFMQVKSYIQNGKRNLKSIILRNTEHRSNE